jgi:hypothetical protein
MRSSPVSSVSRSKSVSADQPRLHTAGGVSKHSQGCVPHGTHAHVQRLATGGLGYSSAPTDSALTSVHMVMTVHPAVQFGSAIKVRNFGVFVLLTDPDGSSLADVTCAVDAFPLPPLYNRRTQEQAFEHLPRARRCIVPIVWKLHGSVSVPSGKYRLLLGS